MQGNGSGHHRDTEAAFGTARHRGPDADRRLKQRLLLRQTDDSVPEDPRHLTARCVLRDRNRAPRGSAGAARPAEQANGPRPASPAPEPSRLGGDSSLGPSRVSMITDFEACRNRSRAPLGGCGLPWGAFSIPSAYLRLVVHKLIA